MGMQARSPSWRFPTDTTFATPGQRCRMRITPVQDLYLPKNWKG